MKKVLIALIVVCASYTAQAQVNSLGPTVGFNYAWLSDVDDHMGRPSYNVGLTYTYSAFQKAGLGIEARYSEEGVKQEIGNTTVTTKLNYIRVPLEFHYFFGELEDNFRPKLFVGPSFGFLMNAKSKVKTGDDSVTTDTKDAFESFDLGIQAGAGFNYRLAELVWLNFDAAYTHGLIDVVDSPNGDNLQNRLINVNVGVAFGF